MDANSRAEQQNRKELLAGNLHQRSVQFHDVGIEAIEAGTPFPLSFFHRKLENREITSFVTVAGESWELLAEIGCGARLRQSLAIFAGKHGAKHALVACMRLAKIQVGHTQDIIQVRIENANGTWVLNAA